MPVDYDAFELKIAKCTACDQVVSLKSPEFTICPNCLTARSCNVDCERKGLEKHKVWCMEYAIVSLTKLMSTTVEKCTFNEWLDTVFLSLMEHGTLPDCCTEKQLDELSVLLPTVHSCVHGTASSDVHDPEPICKVLALATRYALLCRRPVQRVTRLLRDSLALLCAIPPVSEEEGARLWAAECVYVLCGNVGDLMIKYNLPQDAVRLMRLMKPNLDVCLLMKNATHEGNIFLALLIETYRMYSRWVRRCIPPKITKAKYLVHPDRQKMMELLQQGIELGKGMEASGLEIEMAGLGLDLGMGHQIVGDNKMALQVFQQFLKLPWNKRSGDLAVKAAECHILAGRDTQAGKWIDQWLRLEEHCPGGLRLTTQAELYVLRSLLSRRRGQHEEACGHLRKAEKLLEEARHAKAHGPADIDYTLIEVRMDTLDCLEALGVRDLAAYKGLGPLGLGRPVEGLDFVQSIADQGQAAEASAKLEGFTDQVMSGWGFGNHYWRWRLKGVTLWGMEMLKKWGDLVKQLLPEGERRAAVLARIKEMKGFEERMKQKLLDDRRAQAIVEVREQVTGKPAAEGDGILEGTGEVPVNGEGILEATGEATGDRKPSKAARKKRKKRQKKAAQAQHDSSQQGAEAGLEQSISSLSMGQEDEASEGEEPAGVEEDQRGMAKEKEECAICLNELGGDEGRDEEGLVCGHVMHASCLRCWASKCASLSIDTTCPVCRMPLVEESSN